jgi:hypothetical protein
MISPNAFPLDQYAFIDSDLEEEDPLKNLGLNRQKSTADSGMGSDSSTHSYTTSPIRYIICIQVALIKLESIQ